MKKTDIETREQPMLFHLHQLNLQTSGKKTHFLRGSFYIPYFQYGAKYL